MSGNESSLVLNARTGSTVGLLALDARVSKAVGASRAKDIALR